MRRRSLLGSLLAAPFVRLPKAKAATVVGIDGAVGIDETHEVTLTVSPYAQGSYTIGMADGSTIKLKHAGESVKLIRSRGGYHLVELPA